MGIEPGMKVVVTGASGYLGGRLCRRLVAEGHAVRAFVRRSSDLSSLPPSLELAYGDVTDLPSLIAACSGCDLLFHTAALVEPWLPDPSRFFAVNVGGLKNVLQAFRETETLQRIIYTSSFFALGPTDGYVADEKQMHQGKVFCTEYEKSKAMADRIALQAAADGIPVVLLYPGVIYGPGKITTGNIVARILIERFNGRLPGYIGSGSDRTSFCHVEDVVSGHIAAMHKGRVGERYLLAGENASFKHVFDIAALITKRKRPWFHIPLWVIEIYGWISVFFSRITGKLPLISYPTVRVLGHQWAYSCEKAKEELGYSPRSLNEGLTEILLWLKSLGLIQY
ncbi:putative dihydroflavonol 4-reductase [Phoenix dactylifera]|uniref:Dihydroflavonol 4-reductase n=1 Tax=Phoenix dactylifera TaxID=42345 RepID=A0A8B7BNK4_PHODC|nr:putative dihydroflavonol 4-reductase [Phoenix dactylifera]